MDRGPLYRQFFAPGELLEMLLQNHLHTKHGELVFTLAMDDKLVFVCRHQTVAGLEVDASLAVVVLRQRKLEAARDAMLREGATIAQAAFMAGYSSPANVATAFKRAFGVSPSQYRS